MQCKTPWQRVQRSAVHDTARVVQLVLYSSAVLDPMTVECSAVQCSAVRFTMSVLLQSQVAKAKSNLLRSVVSNNRYLTCAERGSRDRGPYSYSVRLCANTECARILWNRDVNAAINILGLFLDWVAGRAKPSQLVEFEHSPTCLSDIYIFT